ncbi:hypothetical protein BGZ65_003298 [Modicella reniformis]|uniref:Protein-serine/threonine kinase n=1 Tax=Modicella reniformis TaxID=1440133 RepID=A0A9P6MHM1_9FUNG|nr:hypothetical protein BGZ65_003298 [Modicella reniformis]
MLPVNMQDMPNFQQIAHSYLEDISMVTQMPKPSTPKLEEEFTALLRNLEQRHKIKVLAINKGFRELMDNLQQQSIESEHLALHDRGLNLVQRVNPLSISQKAIRDAQKVCAAHYGQAAPSVLIHTPNPDISTTYVEEFLHRNIYELLKNAMRATCETHLNKGSPFSLGLLSSKTASNSKLPSIKLILVDGGEDVTIKISDEGGGLALSEMDKIWSYVHSGSSSLRQHPSGEILEHEVSKVTTTTTSYKSAAPNTSTLHKANVSTTETTSRTILQPAD